MNPPSTSVEARLESSSADSTSMRNAEDSELSSYCFAVPHYNHSSEFTRFFNRLVDAGLPIIVVDDGSEEHHWLKIKTLLDEKIASGVDCHYFQHPENRGKGAAVITACIHARALGYTHIIQIDADGQHVPADGFKLIKRSRQMPLAVVSGRPVFDDSAPKARLYGRQVSTVLVALETMSWQVKDALCGFRVYPLKTMEYLTDHFHIGPRMDFDTDVIVKCCWAGFPVSFVDTPVAYQVGGTSHFHYLRDNWRLIQLHSRLLPMMLIRVPLKWFKQLSAKFGQ